MVFNFKRDAEIDIYIHGKDEQYFIHWDWWPERPFVYHLLPHKHTLIELSIKKETNLKDDGCDESKDTKHFGKVNTFLNRLLFSIIRISVRYKENIIKY